MSIVKKTKKRLRTLGRKIGKKNPVFRKWMRHWLKGHREGLYREFIERYEMDEKSVIFESFMGRQYTCSPRAIFEYMATSPDYEDYTFYVVLKKAVIESKLEEILEAYPLLKKAHIVMYCSQEYHRAYASSKYIFANSRIPSYIEIRPGQVFVQCWHGTPLKRLGYDIEMGENAAISTEELTEKYDMDACRYTYMVSPSAFVTEKYYSAFNLKKVNPEVKIVEEGYPRNDALFHPDEVQMQRTRQRLGIAPEDTRKLILYAPTWRDNQHKAGLGYTYELNVDFDKWKERLGEEYIVLFRAHYFIANSFDFSQYSDFVKDASVIDDINELYVIADLLITDYSSVFFDYADLKRPILFYMYDLEEYQGKMRDFYIDLATLPGDIVTEEDELLEKIKGMDYENFYDDRYRTFNETYNYLDDGHAAERVVKAIVG